MIKNYNKSSTVTSGSTSVTNRTNVEELIYHLCAKIASASNVDSRHRDDFINKSYSNMIRLFCSITYCPTHDLLETSQRIKNKLVRLNRVKDANCFSELESKFVKLKLIRNHASILQFFLDYFVEHIKCEANSNKNILHASHRCEAPLLADNVHDNIIEKSNTSKRLVEIFTNDVNNQIMRDQSRLKPTLIVNEGFILRELIYALQGADDLERNVRLLVLRYLEAGWLYLRLAKFLKSYNNSPTAGLVLQAFCAYISAELKEYHRLLAVLESQVTNKELGNKDEGAVDCGSLTLRRLMVWLEQPIERLKYLNIVCDAVKDKKGGVLLSTLHSYSINGDPFKASLLKSGLAKCAIPIRDMIFEWVCDGQIRDLHEEFFVSFDNSVTNDRLWHDKYNLRMTQIPSFISEKQARKILVIGKSINFLRVICSEQKQIKGINNLPPIESMLDQKSDSQFQDIIDAAYADTSTALIKILMEKYKLLDHFNSLRKYLLLGQGDFINHLMDLMEDELSKPATQLMLHNLKRLLDKAITETNAQFDPASIISRLDIRLLTSSASEVGWDVFTLDYLMDGPLKTVFTQKSLSSYLMIFNFLWRVKRMEHTICATWKLQKSEIEKFRPIQEIYEMIHQINIIRSEMLRLVQNLNFYIMFEVLEVSWKILCEKLNEAVDMDQVIAANESFSETIISQLLLDQKSKEIANQVRTIFDLIVKITSLSESFQKLASTEIQMRQEFSEKMIALENIDQPSREKLQKAERTRYNTEVRPKIKGSKNQLGIFRESFQEMVRKLLDMLKNHHNESLRFLSFRFNFNEFYN